MPTTCPVVAAPSSLADLEPLLAALQQDSLPEETLHLPKGVLRPDGRLDLCKQNLGAEGCLPLLEVLSSQALIHTLLLGTNAIGDLGASRVAELIKTGHLETVYLGCNLIGENGIQAIAQALWHNPKVHALWLKRNPIGAAGWHHLTQMLQNNTTLRTLDLVNTSPDHRAVLDLLEVVKTHPSLEYLYLSGNGLDAAEASALANCLALCHLRGIYLSVNHLEDAGATLLAEGIGRNQSLEFLSLSSNGITDKGAEAVLMSLESHPRLAALDLGYAPSTKVLGAQANRLTDALVPSIKRLLDCNPNLQDLNLMPNQFSAAAQAELASSRMPQRQPMPQHADAAKIRSVYR
jgi:Ran GTPase-activating protein (RanGAP) involved in mRNA processing and transport